MKKNLTEVVFILDESGSMFPLTNDTIGGFNSMIAEQKNKSGEAYISTVMFSDRSHVVHDRVPVSEVAEMTENDYSPSGCTALLDAIGDSVKHIGNIHKYARKEDIPEKTLFVITTDGMENASRRYSYAQIKRLITHQQDRYGWEFIFIGANIDSAAVAEDMGIRKENAVDYLSDSEGTEALYCSVGKAITNARSAMPLNESWREDIDRDTEKRRAAPNKPKSGRFGRNR